MYFADKRTVSGPAVDPAGGTSTTTSTSIYADNTPAGLTWASDWIEENDKDGAGAGDIRIEDDDGDNALRFNDKGKGRAVEGVLQTFAASDFVFVSYGELVVEKTSDAADPLLPGEAFTYTGTVTLKDKFDTPATPDHHVVVQINDTTVGESAWDGKSAHEFTVHADPGVLCNGDNTITVTGLLETGVPYSIFYLDGFVLTYQRQYEAVDDRLTFTGGDLIGKIVPPGHTTEKIYLSEQPSAREANRLVLDALNKGVFVMNYFGHGGVDRMATEGMLTKDDVPFLRTRGTLPIVTAMTCVVGQFAIPGYDSLSEVLVLHDRGAIAMLAPTGLSMNEEAKMLDEEFFYGIFDDSAGAKTLGEILVKAFEFYATRGERYILEINNLLGDPAMPLR